MKYSPTATSRWLTFVGTFVAILAGVWLIIGIIRGTGTDLPGRTAGIRHFTPTESAFLLATMLAIGAVELWLGKRNVKHKR